MRKLNNILVTLPIDDSQKDKITRLSPDSHFTFLAADEVQAEMLGQYDAILGNVPAEYLKYAHRLRWNQLGGVGTEGYDEPDAMNSEVILTNATGAYGRAVAGQAYAMLWTLMKQLHRYRDNQKNEVWKPLGEVQSIEGKTAVILGFGDIGQQFASYLRPFDVRIVGINLDGMPHQLADEMHTLADLNAVLPEADIIMNALPGTKETRHIIGRAQLAAMKHTAILLNVGRGMTVDLDALCQAVQDEKLWGAGLDVLSLEPLPKGHPAWKIPGILISPHVAGGFNLPYTLEQVVEITCENLYAYLNGQTMRNIISRG